MRNESYPYWDVADTLTAHASTALYGRRLVSVVGPTTEGNPTIGYCAGGARPFGVTGYDVAVGAKVTIHHQQSIITPVEAGAPIGAAQLCTTDAEGRAIPATGTTGIVGQALDPAQPGEDVKLDRSVRA